MLHLINLEQIKARLREHHARDLTGAIQGHYDSDPIYTDALDAITRLETALLECASEHARPGSVRCQWCGEFTGTQPDPAATARYLRMLGKL